MIILIEDVHQLHYCLDELVCVLYKLVVILALPVQQEDDILVDFLYVLVRVLLVLLRELLLRGLLRGHSRRLFEVVIGLQVDVHYGGVGLCDMLLLCHNIPGVGCRVIVGYIALH